MEILDYGINSQSEECKALSKIPTYQLVNELKKREGVETHMIGPYAKFTVDLEGPAIVLHVID